MDTPGVDSPGMAAHYRGCLVVGKDVFSVVHDRLRDQGIKFLGLDVDAQKFFFISNENDQRDFVSFMAARGITADEL